MKSYVDYGVVEDPASKGVRLKMSGYQVWEFLSSDIRLTVSQEAVVFAEVRLPMEIWELLPQLDEGIELFWILAGKENKMSVPLHEPVNFSFMIIIAQEGILVPPKRSGGGRETHRTSGLQLVDI